MRDVVSAVLVPAPLVAPRRCISSRPRAGGVVRMGPPLPSREIGHAKGGKNASVTVGAWLDYACPFSAKFHATFVEKVLPHYGDDVRLLVYHQVQPWHPQSTMLHEAAIAVADVGGNDAFWKFSSALYATQSDFFDANAWDKSRAQIYDELAALAETSAGVSAMDVSARLTRVVDPDGAALNTGNASTQTLKFHVKLGRQFGVHVSPTATLNGMVCDTSSGWGLDEWRAFLDPHVKAAKAA